MKVKKTLYVRNVLPNLDAGTIRTVKWNVAQSVVNSLLRANMDGFRVNDGCISFKKINCIYIFILYILCIDILCFYQYNISMKGADNMATTSITIRMDENLKKQAEILFEDMGLNMTTAITMFTKAVVRQNKIPFEISADPFYSESNMKVLEQRIANLESGKSVLKEHDLIEV